MEEQKNEKKRVITLRFLRKIMSSSYKFTKIDTRSSRMEFVSVTLLGPILLLATMPILLIIGGLLQGSLTFLFGAMMVVWLIIAVLTAVASFCSVIRRLKDLNLPAWASIPLVVINTFTYGFVYFALMLIKSKGHNKYGPNVEDNLFNLDKDLKNYIYYKYFKMGYVHDGMSEMEAMAYNEKKANAFKKEIKEELFQNFENAYSAFDEIDFNKSLPSFVSDKTLKDFLTDNDLTEKEFRELLLKYKRDISPAKMQELKLTKDGIEQLMSQMEKQKEKSFGDD